ncbi:MAG: STAS/SEC14 domain-containing protein [Maritimibacter sp.]|nr:STAS/SEC14 domain-containing protein [Maritimibacter sp.]
MMELKETQRADMLHVHVSGSVTDADYRDVLMPAIDAATEGDVRVRLLLEMDSNVSDFTLGALWDDARTGLKHWRGFDRIAVVTGSKGIATAIKAFSVILPCPVMVFQPGQVDEAKRWLTESLGAIHQTDLGDGALEIQLLGKLDSAVYDAEVEQLNAFIRANTRFRLLLDIRDFDGWQGFGALGEHFKLVRDHAPMLDRAAIVGDAGWQKMAVGLGKRLLGKEARYFPAEDHAAARDWLKS